jgi:hypothetical protein
MIHRQQHETRTRERASGFRRTARSQDRRARPWGAPWRRLAQDLLEESYALRTIQMRQVSHADQS